MPAQNLLKRVVDSARDSGWTATTHGEKVDARWCSPDKVHVFVYIDQGFGEPSLRNYLNECNTQLLPLSQSCKLRRLCTKSCGEKTLTATWWSYLKLG